MISSLCWVPRGASKAVPIVAQIDEAELQQAQEQLAKLEHSKDEEGGSSEEGESSEDAEEAGARARAVASGMESSADPPSSSTAAGIEAAMRELDMDHYDDSDDENVISRLMGSSRAEIEDGDPYITLEDDDDRVSDVDDYTIRPTDLIILAAKNEDDVSNLEVWLYEEAGPGEEANVYVHHDILIPAFPLCLAWLDCDPHGLRDRANLVAIGTMEPGIEIWDLDVVDAVEPVATLGGLDRSASAAAAAGRSEDGVKQAVSWRLPC